MHLFIDTETSGVSRYQDHIVQVAWILTDITGRIESKQCHLVRPQGFSIPEGAVRIHGITTAFANKNGRPLKEVLIALAADASKASVVVAHNVQFDLGILEHDYDTVRLPFPFHGKTRICTMMSSITWCQLPKLNGRAGFKFPKLEELHYKIFKTGFDGAHDAMQDTIACMKCYFQLVKFGVISPPSSHRASDQSGKRLAGGCPNPVVDQTPTRATVPQFKARNSDAAKQRATQENQKLATEQASRKRAEEIESNRLNRENEIQRKYDKRLASLSDAGSFLLWWIGGHSVFWIFLVNVAPRMKDSQQFFISAFVGVVIGFFARLWFQRRKMKSPAYLACSTERDREISAVRNPAAAKTPLANSGSISQPVGGATSHSAHEVGEPPLALIGRPYRNQFCDPMNLARLQLMLNSVPEHPGYAVLTGEGKIRYVVVYGANVKVAVKVFVESVTNGSRSDWDDFLSLGFSPVNLLLVNSRPENAGKEYELARTESAQTSKGGRSRLFAGSMFVPAIAAKHSSSDRSYSPTIDLKTTPQIAVCVPPNKSEAAVELSDLSRTPIGCHASPSASENSSEGIHNQPVLLSMPLRGYVPLSRCGQVGSLLTDQYVSDFGADLMYFLECQCHRIHWEMSEGYVNASDMQNTVPTDFLMEKEDFGVDLVDATFLAVRQFLNDIEVGFPEPFHAAPEITQDFENFGVDLVAMASKVIRHVMVKNLIPVPCVPPSPAGAAKVGEGLSAEAKKEEEEEEEEENRQFRAGASVIHKIKGSELGTGIIRKMSGQYLTVNFPASNREFQLLTSTADEFLMLASERVDLAGHGRDKKVEVPIYAPAKSKTIHSDADRTEKIVLLTQESLAAYKVIQTAEATEEDHRKMRELWRQMLDPSKR